MRITDDLPLWLRRVAVVVGATALLLANRPPTLDDLPPEILTAPAPDAAEPVDENETLGNRAAVPSSDRAVVDNGMS